MNFISDIISKFQGVRPMARALGYPPSTVQNWEDRQSIPAKHFKPILEAAQRTGVELTAEQLLGIKPKKPRSN